MSQQTAFKAAFLCGPMGCGPLTAQRSQGPVMAFNQFGGLVPLMANPVLAGLVVEVAHSRQVASLRRATLARS